MPVRELKTRRDSQLFAEMCALLLRLGHQVEFRAEGRSMQPNLLNGDDVRIAPVQPGELRRGEIALIQNPDGLLVHRVALNSLALAHLLTRGDTGHSNDLPAGRVYGKVVRYSRNGRSIAVSPWRARFVHPVASFTYRLAAAFRHRLSSVTRLLFTFALLIASAMLLSPSASAQTADLQLVQTPSATSVAAGTTFTYTEVVTNNTSSATVTTGTITVYMQTPPNTNYQAYAGTNWNCSHPAVGAAGPVICTYNTTLANGAVANTLTVNFQVTAGTAAGTTIQNSATVTNSTFVDNVPANNTSLSSIVVEPVASSDLAVSISAAPTPVFISSTLTYTITVQNLGQAAAPVTANVLSDTLPAAVTNPSVVASAGWSCSGTATISCSITSAMAAGAVATITITVTTPSTAQALSNQATAALPGDPNSLNNTASVLTVVQPLVCASPGKDGPGGTLGGVVNTYYPPSATGTLAAGSTSVALGTAAGAGSTINSGDLLLIIQMQAASINYTNTGAYGDGLPGDPASGYLNGNSSGLFEFVTATNQVLPAGGTLNFIGSGPTGGLLNSYYENAATATQGQQVFQVVRVPQYTSATLSSTLVPLTWSGSLGGVLAIDVSAQLTLGGTVVADGFGFRGGGGVTSTGPPNGVTEYNTDYLTVSPSALPNLGGGGQAGAIGSNGSKGEGIAGTPHWVSPAVSTIVPTSTAINTNQTVTEGLPTGSFARGAPGNAGGGGTDGAPASNSENSGGGAGSNGGSGGQGGYGWNSMAATNSTNGGFGGAAFSATTSALIMGGGGGAGTTNDGSYFISTASDGADCGTSCTGVFSSGGAGGGIVIVHTGSVAGTGTITSNGSSTLSTLNDSTGGAGAGGSILFFANSGTLSGLTVNAIGGNGGQAWPKTAPGGFPGQRHGPGGGGGGGVIFLSSAPTAYSVAGGINGNTNTVQDSYGSTPGTTGLYQNTHIITETPGTQPGAYCASTDLYVTNSAPAIIAAGANLTYTQTAVNSGTKDAVNAVFSENTPANTTFSSITPAAGWTCSTPAVGTAGTISCSDPDFAAGATAPFSVVVTVAAGTSSGTQIVNVDNITSGTRDPNLANNSASAVTTVAAATSADMVVVNTASPATVLAGNVVTMTAVVSNQGPSAASAPTFTEAIPITTTFAGIASIPAGWNCNPLPPVGGNGTITCTAATLAVNAPVSFAVQLTVPSGTASGTVISDTANVSSSTADPNPTNNTYTATATVATSGQADLSVATAASPNPVSPGNNITYTQSVTNNGPAVETNAIFTDVLPANTTFVSFTNPNPAVWSCSTPAVGAVGTVKCTLISTNTIPVNSTVNFPLVVTVAAATAPGTVISNSPTVSSTVGDPNPANNTATSTTIVAGPTQADVSIIKTAAPEPVNQGTNLAYTLQVTNGGPAVAQGVVVTDVLPSQVSYTSVFTTQGTCTYTAATTTVSCALGSLSVGSNAVVTINVTALTFSSASLTNNTATVSATTSDPNSSNNTSTATSTIQSPSAVDVSSLRAYPQADGSVVVEWRTHQESRNLGFHVYRESPVSGRERITPSLIAGSALLLRGSRPEHAGKLYRWIDAHPVPGSSYSIEDVDINGTRTFHGSAIPEAELSTGRPQAAAVAASSPLLSHLRASVPSPVHQRSPNFVQRPLRPVAPVAISSVTLASHPAVKLAVSQEGWYRVSFAQLFAAGLDANADPRSLHLYAEGIEQSLLLDLKNPAAISSTDSLEFYGTGIDTPFSAERNYWLISDNTASKPIVSVNAIPAQPEPFADSFPFSVIRQDRIIYFASLLNGVNNDNFFGAAVTSEPVDQTLSALHSDSSSQIPVSLDVTLQGATTPQDHRVSVQLNATLIGELDFSNQTLTSQSFSIPSALLHDGENTVTLTSLNGDNDVSAVVSLELHYPHTYTADSNWLRATARSGAEIRIDGFTNPRIRVFDLTDPFNIVQLTGAVAADSGSGSYNVSVQLPYNGRALRTILALADDAISSPDSLAYHAPAFLNERRSRADLAIIAHPDFVAAVAPLVQFRESQGHRVALVTTDQIYDQYNYGERSPFAIRSYLQAASQASRAPESVLLVGGASLDPRDYLGFGSFDFVPTRLIETAAFKTASDDWFSDFDESGFATIPTGRLPVRTAADASMLVSRIINYETGVSSSDWNSRAVLVADQNIDANFSSAVTAAAANLPSSLQPSLLFTDGVDPSIARAQITAALNHGALLVDYEGHGAQQQWSFADLFDYQDAAALQNGDRLPVFLLMDCLNGFFQDVYAESLAQSILLAPNGGGIAVWASSGFTDQPPQATMNQAFLSELKSHPTESLGAIALHAKSGTTDSDVRRTWILFGDPSMKLRLPTSPAPASPSQTSFVNESRALRPSVARCSSQSPCDQEKP